MVVSAGSSLTSRSGYSEKAKWWAGYSGGNGRTGYTDCLD